MEKKRRDIIKDTNVLRKNSQLNVRVNDRRKISFKRTSKKKEKKKIFHEAIREINGVEPFTEEDIF